MKNAGPNYCSKCGSGLESGVAFCGSCGARIKKGNRDAVENVDAGSELANEEPKNHFTLSLGLVWSSSVFVLGLGVWALGFALRRPFTLIDYFANVVGYSALLTVIFVVGYLITRRQKEMFKYLAIGSTIWAILSLVVTLGLVGGTASDSKSSPNPVASMAPTQSGDAAACAVVTRSVNEHDNYPRENNPSLWSASDVKSMWRWLGYQIDAIDLAMMERPSDSLEKKMVRVRELFRESSRALLYPTLDAHAEWWNLSRPYFSKLLTFCDSVAN
jgi:hypothetical protein